MRLFQSIDTWDRLAVFNNQGRDSLRVLILGAVLCNQGRGSSRASILGTDWLNPFQYPGTRLLESIDTWDRLAVFNNQGRDSLRASILGED